MKKVQLDMSMAIALEDIAIGEADLATASKAIAAYLKKIDDDAAHELYDALRSWLWKALDARRRDDELPGWLDIITRVSSQLAERWSLLAIKLDGFAELLQASVTVAQAPAKNNLASRKHVREIVAAIYGAGGSLPRKALVRSLKLKDANLTRIAAPLQDEGWLQREVIGREVVYRLTERGKAKWLPVIAGESKPRQPKTEAMSVLIFRDLHLDSWKMTRCEGQDLAHDSKVSRCFYTSRTTPAVRIDELGDEFHAENDWAYQLPNRNIQRLVEQTA